MVLGHELSIVSIRYVYADIIERTDRRTLNRYWRIMSDSSLVTPLMRLVKPLFTYTDFQPVTAIFN